MNNKTPDNILIVDGYNVIRSSGMYVGLGEPEGGSLGSFTATPDFADYTHDHFNAARDALINDVAVFAHRRYKPTVVFDGAGNPSSTGNRTEVAGVGVIFSAAGVCADATIEELVHQAVEAGHDVLVVTSDATLQWTVLGKRVTRMSALGFADEVHTIKKNTIDEVRLVTYKNTLGDRLDDATRLKLAQMIRRSE